MEKNCMMNKYPLKLSPVFKEIIWGGDKLKKEFNKKSDLEKLAESWELTCRYDGMNTIENGEYAGMTLEEYLGKEAEGFPLLIKLIDACDKLSIQVHPDDDYAQKNEGEYGKTEMWYIVDAKPGAQLVYGLKNYNKETFAAAAENGTLEQYLNFVDVHKGDVFFIPSGCVHAIGAGILIAEIQQSSNVTYRVYDYNRIGKDGKLRPLHVKKALDVIKDYTPDQIDEIRFSAGKTENALANCQYFKVEHRIGSTTLQVGKSFLHVLCLEGTGTIGGYPINKGDSYFLPAESGTVEITGNVEIITSEAR
jgi:mannose-6-phosphate isomerase